MSTRPSYIPALRFNLLTPFYDPVLRWGMREMTFKRRLIEHAHIASGQRVLDLGCGTGTLTVLIKRLHPHAEVIGIDGDKRVLVIAREKATSNGIPLTFDLGMAYELPYDDQSFDQVVSSLLMHHLTTENKQRAINEVYRILRRGGEFLIVDFGKPQNLIAQIISLVMRRMERAAETIDGILPTMLHRTGFSDVGLEEQFMTIFGTLTLYRGHKP